MRRLLFFIFIAITIEPACLFGQSTNRLTEKILTQDQFSAILDALDTPFAKSQVRDQAIAELRGFGTNSFPLLMEELKAVGAIQATNVTMAMNRKTKLQAAFEVLGPEARPLLPELVAEFKAGRNLGNVPHALAQIGGDEAGIVLVQAITNADPQIRAASASSLKEFKNNPNIAREATRPLLLLLNDPSGPLRSMAADTLGVLRVNSDVVVPALLHTAEKDPDSVVRLVSITSIGRFGTNAMHAQTRLQKIVEADMDNDVRKSADRALKAIHN